MIVPRKQTISVRLDKSLTLFASHGALGLRAYRLPGMVGCDAMLQPDQTIRTQPFV